MAGFSKKQIVRIRTTGILLLWLSFASTCRDPRVIISLRTDRDTPPSLLPLNHDLVPLPTVRHNFTPGSSIQTGSTDPATLVEFAKTQIGVPYLYASTDPRKGFDCSGFITYVFNHFGISVPRSSVDFTEVGKEINETDCRPGDIILFTGTDSTIRVVGHMAIIVSNDNGVLQFIHSTSGKLKGVVITPFENYYRSRFVKIIRLFPD